MKLLAGLLLTAAIALPTLRTARQVDFAAFAEAQARAQVGSHLVAENMHRMK
jgi:hypothetical protein